jgi:hypothetical protein
MAACGPRRKPPWPPGGSGFRGAPAAPAYGQRGRALARNRPATIANSPIVTAQGHRAGSPADAPETSPAMELPSHLIDASSPALARSWGGLCRVLADHRCQVRSVACQGIRLQAPGTETSDGPLRRKAVQQFWRIAAL